jgi:Zn-dependent protease
MQSDTLELLLYFIPALLIAISLHETMHSVMGYWLGDDTAKMMGRISFNPLKHIDPLTTIALPLMLVVAGLPPFAAAKPVPVNFARLKYEEFGMALVGIAGPLTNLLLAIVFAGILKLVEPSGVLLKFILANISINVGLFVFNMIPFPPLDGSRVLYAFVPEFIQRGMEKIERMGFMAIVLFMFIAFPFISPLLLSVNQAILNFVVG